MEYLIYLIMFLITGFIFGMIIRPKKKSDMDIKILMAKAQLEFFRSPEGKAHRDRMNDLVKRPPLPEPINFSNNTWTKTEEK